MRSASVSVKTSRSSGFPVTVCNELALALAEIDPPERVDLLLECPECSRVFWAGRDDKKACDKHAGTIRKRKQRRNEKAEQIKAGKQAAEHKRVPLKEETVKRFSRRAVALLDAIVIGGNRKLIDLWTATH